MPGLIIKYKINLFKSAVLKSEILAKIRIIFQKASSYQIIVVFYSVFSPPRALINQSVGIWESIIVLNGFLTKYLLTL